MYLTNPVCEIQNQVLRIVLKPHTKFTKTISGITYSYRIVTQVTVPANGNVDADIFGMNGGTPSNLANNTTLTSPTTGVVFLVHFVVQPVEFHNFSH
jgi:hypothetical protein